VEIENNTYNNFKTTKCSFKAAMSNPKGLLSQTLCHYLNQGRTLNGFL